MPAPSRLAPMTPLTLVPCESLLSFFSPDTLKAAPLRSLPLAVTEWKRAGSNSGCALSKPESRIPMFTPAPLTPCA
ncbi:Uncharacterised protein [Serratia ficaria]|nr:Uncharacterised protein [Serratia ficaria]CAI1196501.1 Uncharacterised protein [Serratia ficaria]CAI1251988.1 Uncharacterised protein [Serratia ficaria]CAI1956223.1 Uncharacterised protein [Serratia ficaria]CAI2016714.1 Uncharacterised protein [Serratia ficaria]